MNISCRSHIKGYAVLASLFFLLSFNLSNTAKAQDVAAGEALFKASCASCHKATDKVSIGPGLKGAHQRWIDAGIGDMFYDWIQNPKKTLDKGHPYVTGLVAKFSNQALMTAQPVSREQIDNIMAYVDGYTEPITGDPKVDQGAVAVSKDEAGSWIWWLVLGGIFFVIAVSTGSVRRQLINANREKKGKEPLPDVPYFTVWKAWAWRNKILVSFVFLFVILAGLTNGWYRLKDVGVFENYKPEQPIAFSHKIHAGDNKIACQYCHPTTEKSKHASIPDAMLCMNCHKNIQSGTLTKETEISKIYKAVGFDPETMSYTGETNPIKWVKVHNMPDHVFFSHQQHVVAGKLECKQCHGDMEKETVARVMPHEELNAINKEFGIEVTRATLTMGWCIECHQQSAVQMGSGNGYYDEMQRRLMLDPELYKKHIEDGKITVQEMGGWECAKCHY